MEFIGTCSSSEIAKIAESCKRKLSKKKMNVRVKREYPDLFEELSLHLTNPFDYYQSKTHFDLVHSAVDYVFKK
jgi:hypothetical protein